jgi:hypothetical protein
MAGGKRMTKDEKRKVVLDIYHKSKGTWNLVTVRCLSSFVNFFLILRYAEVYTEKEILALIAKAGVNAGEEVNNALVDDGLADKEKIGGSNFFWSFPGKKDRLLQIQYETLLEEIEASKIRLADAESKLADAKRGREDEDGERATKLARLAALEKEKQSLTTELESLKENDPQALADLEQEYKLVLAAANRWTDNIFQVS